MTRLFKHIRDFLNRHSLTKTLFSNANSIYLHINLEESQLVSDALVNELQYGSQFINMVQKVDLSLSDLIFSPFIDLPRHKSIASGEYGLIHLEPNFLKPIKDEIRSPVYVEGDSIMISSQQLEISKPYYVRLENRIYVVFMPEEGIVDLYALPE